MLSFNTRFLPRSEKRSTTLRIQVLCLVFCTSILQSSWKYPQAARIRSSDPHVRSFCVRYFCVSVLFPAQIALARFLYFVHFIRVPFNNCLHPCIYLFGSFLLFPLFVRRTCLSFPTIVILSDEDNKILPTWSPPNTLRSGIRIKRFKYVTPQKFFIVSPHLCCFLLSSIHSIALFFSTFFWVFHSPES